jgi:TonB-dependent starch-binding outer membrane protein SusC
MKIALFSIVSLFSVFYASAQNVSLIVKNATLPEVISILNEQHYSVGKTIMDSIESSRLITLNLKDVSIEYALQQIFIGQPYTYKIEGKWIFLTYTPPSRSDSNRIEVQGYVLNVKEEPIPGANIKVHNCPNKVTNTDNRGHFSIKNMPQRGRLTISHIAYEPAHFNYRPGVIPRIKLKSIVTNLDTVRIESLFSTTFKLNTGSATKVKSIDIQNQSVPNFTLGMQGRVTGLDIVQESGVPGAAAVVMIRGKSSIANGSEPLYIIDGIPFNNQSMSKRPTASGVSDYIDQIWINDNQDITVLKDADGTAIYGARGANGVVIINTKKPPVGALTVDANMRSGIGKAIDHMELMDQQQYLEMRKEAFTNDSTKPGPFDHDLNGDWSTKGNTNWKKQLIGRTFSFSDMSMRFAGGTDQTQVSVSLRQYSQTTVFPGANYDRSLFYKINLHHHSKDNRWDISAGLNYTGNNRQLPQQDLTQFIFAAPTAPAIYQTDGKLNFEKGTFANPMGETYRINKSNTKTVILNAMLVRKFSKSFTFKTNLGASAGFFKEIAINPLGSSVYSYTNDSSMRRNFTAMSSRWLWIIEPQLDFDKSLGRNNFYCLVGVSAQQSIQRGRSREANGFSDDLSIWNLRAAGSIKNEKDISKYSLGSGYFRLGYDFDEKYVINITGRADGSNMFYEGNRVGYFGSVGVAWVFSSDSLIRRRLKFVSLGKVRASYGLTGNDRISGTQFMDTYTEVTGAFSRRDLMPTRLPNRSFRWENIYKFNMGIDLYFENGISLNIDYYNHRSKNQILRSPLASITGFESMIDNVPAIVSNSGIELMAQANIINSSERRWTSAFTITIPRNKLLRYPDLSGSYYVDKLAVGYPLAVRYLFVNSGINPQTGLAEFQNKETSPSPEGNVREPVIITKEYYGGWGNTFNYKGFSLDIFLQYVKQTGYRYSGMIMPGSYSEIGSNLPNYMVDRWQHKDDNTIYQKFSAGNILATNAYNRFVESSAVVQNASFIRLKTVSVAWLVPRQILQSFKVRSATFYVQSQNLLTITKFQGMDPEPTLFHNYPVLPPVKTLSIGAKITL